MKKKHTNLIVFLVLAGILVVFYMTGESYYEGLTGKSSQEKESTEVYQYKYDMIVDGPDSPFW